MNACSDWLKQMVCCLCFLELFYQLLPGKKWQKYLQFTGGIIFMLILFQPVLQAFSLEDRLEERTWKWQIQEEGAQFQEEQKELEIFQKEQIRKGYSRELEKQIQKRTEYYGGKVNTVQVDIQKEDAGQIQSIRISLLKELPETDRLREELADDYGIAPSQIRIWVENGTKDNAWEKE